MDFTLGSRLKHAWNAFMDKGSTNIYQDIGIGYSYRPDRPRMTRGNERSIITSVFNRIALDVAAIKIQHVRLDHNMRFISAIESGLNNCLSIESNIDQTGRAFIQDIVTSMLDEGCVAIVPIDTKFDPKITGSYDINSMRTGKILEWYPKHVRVRVYNDKTGMKEDITIPKSTAAIIENPLYSVVNEPNSTLQRLIRKLNLLDVVDEQSSSGKLDLLIQLPYTIKSELRRQQAENRRKDIENQLFGSKYGIAYTDATERVTQLNRPVENTLMSQIEYLTSMLYSQLGITQSILDGTADDKTMLNYYNRTIEPIISAIVDEMKRTFLTKTARSQFQSITFFRDPFKLVPVNDIAEIADKFTRNEIMSSNEIRQIIGLAPADDPKADELRNKNLNQSTDEMASNLPTEEPQQNVDQEEYNAKLQELDDIDAQLDILESELEEEQLKHYASPYYDPAKAHEYYMRNRELKERKSTAKLNDEGKNAAKYVKEQLTKERKSKVEFNKDIMQKKIDTIREQLKNMSKEQKSQNKEMFKKQISSLREQNKQERVRLKEEYETKYIRELDRMRSDAAFKKVPKKRSKK